MPPPHLHPRSRSTTSLFAATLLASFFIVGLPHVFPCPAPRRALADCGTTVAPDGQQLKPRRRRRKTREVRTEEATNGTTTAPTEPDTARAREFADEVAEFRNLEEEAKQLSKANRQCPVPKPRSVIGNILGFDRDQAKRETSTPSRVDIQSRDGN